MKSKFGVIPIEGPIHEGENLWSQLSLQGGTDVIKRYIQKASGEDIKALIFSINSPGGTPYASRNLAKSIRNLAIPTVAWIRENCLSGAYWVASSCDQIVADELSKIGGIGVIGIRPDLSDLMNKLGIKLDVLSKGELKDLGLPFKGATDEEREVLDEELDAINEVFVSDIAENRNVDKDKIGEISKGRPYLGMKAKELGLIDHLGEKEKAIEICKNLTESTDFKLIDYGDQIRKEQEEATKIGLSSLIRKFLR